MELLGAGSAWADALQSLLSQDGTTPLTPEPEYLIVPAAEKMPWQEMAETASEGQCLFPEGIFDIPLISNPALIFDPYARSYNVSPVSLAMNSTPV